WKRAITLAPKKLIRTRRASEGSASEPSLARRVSMCKDAKLSCRGNITQRGNRRQQTFFGEEDYQHYLELMSQFCRAEQVAIWAYCLIPNHVHLIVVPQSAESLCRAIGEAHPRYTRWINFREGWRGHLWQGRFASFVRERGVRARTLAPGIWREPGRLAVEDDLHVCDTSGTGTHGTAARPPP